MTPREDAIERAKPIRLLLFDADGVMTDGRLLFGPAGEEWKAFHSRDGLGIRLAQSAGLKLGIISGRRSTALERRANELQLDEFHHGVADKLVAYEAVRGRLGLEPAEIAFIGDDLVDLPVLRKVGLAAAVPEAVEAVLAHAHLVTAARGGEGAVREVIEFILTAQGNWDAILKRFGGA
jgi:3-deoxy-D-manno-octulosonate 8-phosphate phosphatase (KDO 8-P phosphatase)